MSKGLLLALLGVSALIIVVVAAAAYAGARLLADSESRQEAVAARGALVMPFDLDSTTHVFRKVEDGGVQTVTADDPSDAEQVTLIRSHLQQEAERFQRGDFADPAAIHGEEMPGLAELSRGADRLAIAYHELPDGASVTYSSEDAALVAALHRWFDAQVSDHGRHARQ